MLAGAECRQSGSGPVKKNLTWVLLDCKFDNRDGEVPGYRYIRSTLKILKRVGSVG
jgi:hypothetical protein